MDHADATESTGTTILSDQLMPTVEQIALDPAFSPREIDQGEFSDAWQRATAHGRHRGGFQDAAE
jgi:hypothetical protein